jgi:hypothetical protein
MSTYVDSDPAPFNNSSLQTPDNEQYLGNALGILEKEDEVAELETPVHTPLSK